MLVNPGYYKTLNVKCCACPNSEHGSTDAIDWFIIKTVVSKTEHKIPLCGTCLLKNSQGEDVKGDCPFYRD